jgi:CRP-like cAMP-binding protein
MSAVSRPPNRLLQALPVAEYEQLHPLLETVELTKDTVLADAGAPVQRVYLPHSGVVSMMVHLSDGQSVEIATVGRDNIVGVTAALDGGPLFADAIVAVPGTASVLKAEDFREMADRNVVFRTLVSRLRPSSPSRATFRIRLRRGYRAGCSARGICAAARHCR